MKKKKSTINWDRMEKQRKNKEAHQMIPRYTLWVQFPPDDRPQVYDIKEFKRRFKLSEKQFKRAVDDGVLQRDNLKILLSIRISNNGTMQQSFEHGTASESIERLKDWTPEWKKQTKLKAKLQRKRRRQKEQKQQASRARINRMIDKRNGKQEGMERIVGQNCLPESTSKLAGPLLDSLTKPESHLIFTNSPQDGSNGTT